MLEALLERLHSQPSRTGSVIITLFGDAIAPRGGSLSLSDITEIFAAMGVGEGVVRTAVSRLAADGWLARTKLGRRSFYRLAPKGQAETEAATPLIYGPPNENDAPVRVAFLEPGAERTAQGYAAAAPGVLIGVGVPPAESLVLDVAGDSDTLRRLAARAWKLEALAERYAVFLALVPEASAIPQGIDALLARLLLIHEYRRAALRDPNLPPFLLPEDWPGQAARARCAMWYDALRGPSEAWLDRAEGEHGALPVPVRPNVFA